MRYNPLFKWALLGSLGVAGAALAQTGQNEALLRRAIGAVAQGQCPADILAPMLRGACLQQMPAAGQRIAAMGAVTGVEFLGTQAVPSGPPVEVYRVTFSAGGSMTWSVNSGPDGKLMSLWFS